MLWRDQIKRSRWAYAGDLRFLDHVWVARRGCRGFGRYTDRRRKEGGWDGEGDGGSLSAGDKSSGRDRNASKALEHSSAIITFSGRRPPIRSQSPSLELLCHCSTQLRAHCFGHGRCYYDYRPLLTSGYTSNRRCVVTGIPARASSNVLGSVMFSVSAPTLLESLPVLVLTNARVYDVLVVLRLCDHLAPAQSGQINPMRVRCALHWIDEH